MSTYTDGKTGNTLSYAARDKSGHLSFFKFDRQEPGASDVEFRIEFCGICHSDLHQIRGEWGGEFWPMVPGHELVGVVTSVGANVKGFAVGDHVGVGCMVGSCKIKGSPCRHCARSYEQFCSGAVFTYNSKWQDGKIAYGGYSSRMVVDQQFCLRVPKNLPLDRAAPLLCAGITVWSPMKHHGMDKPGFKLGVVGLGGLGHMAVKFGVQMGCEVTVISTSEGKRQAAMKDLGAHHFLVSKDKEAMEAAGGTLDGIIDTVSAKHDLSDYVKLLDVFGKLVLVGISPEPLPLDHKPLVFCNRAVIGSVIGGIKETQEMLDFCGEKNVAADVEVISIKTVNEAMERMIASDVKYRFVIDIARTLADEGAQ